MGDLNIFLAIGFALLILFLVSRVFFKPLRFVIKIGVNVVLGALIIWVLNMVGAPIGLELPLNVVTAVTAGFLGLPGTVLLLALHALVV